MQTALHIKALVSQLREQVIGARIVSTEFYKKERSAFLFMKTGKGRVALGFVYHPHGAGVFLVPASKVKVETREKPWPFFDLAEASITDVVQTEFDRIFSITVNRKGKENHIIVEALGPNGNLWLVNTDGKTEASLRRRVFQPGTAYAAPARLEGLSPLGLEADRLSELIRGHPDTQVRYLMEKHVLGFNRTLAAEAVVRADVPPEGLSESDASKLAETIGDLANRFGTDGTGYLYSGRGRVEVYPFRLAGEEEQPEKFKTLSLAVAAMCARRQIQTEEADTRKATIQMVKRAIKRLTTRLRKIEDDITEASDFDRYRRWGELLQIAFNQLRKGMAEIAVADVYDDGEPSITIALDPALSPADNVEVYFRRYRKGREGLDIMKRRGQISTAELQALQEMMSRLEDNFETALAQYEAELAALRPRASGTSEVAPRLPFRSYTLSTGLTIYVGRDGSDNDRTTFEFARPYETWMHVQQCPGSHVVIKYPNKSFEPSKREIEEAAGITAWFSKARNNSLVPVAYTLRKYVRKPRKAKSGLVTVEREKSIMVAPTKPDQS